jgi:hypothetical protein
VEARYGPRADHRTVNLTRGSSASTSNFWCLAGALDLAHWRTLKVRRIEKEVAIYSHIEPIADGNFDRRLHIQVAACDLCASSDAC